MRVAIVNDMVMAVEALRRAVLADPAHKVIWVAHDGKTAIDEAKRDRPDLILMDLYMPVIDGVEAIRQIMHASPCAILVVTATIEGHAAKVFQALGAGALDAVSTPVLAGPGGVDGQHHFLAKLEIVKRLITAKRSPKTNSGIFYEPTPYPDRTVGKSRRLVVIGASAGGPQAIADVLGTLPRSFPPIIVVQHIDSQFASGMASWLDQQCPLVVKIAKPGEVPRVNTVYVAGSDDHLVVGPDGALHYTPEPRESNYRPCIDVFFFSVARHWYGKIAAALLTGMGRDGAAGLKALRDAGAFTIAQDQKSSIVYGMPKAAAQLQAADEILPLTEIGPALRARMMREAANA